MTKTKSKSKKFNPLDYLVKIKGKDYLMVKDRLVWFREQHPDWVIMSTLVDYKVSGEDSYAIVEARIYDEKGGLRANGFGLVSARKFGRFVEKASTTAVGRALAELGLGTQFALELDENGTMDDVVDSPVAGAAVSVPVSSRDADLPTKEQLMAIKNIVKLKGLGAVGVPKTYGEAKQMILELSAKKKNGKNKK